jgi:hypothetical protein
MIGFRLIKWSLIIIAINGCNAQSERVKENRAIQIVRAFYEKNHAIWSTPYAGHQALGKKLDSLAELYCTPSLRVEAQSWFEDGHDLYTDDWVLRITAFSIVQEPGKENSVVVSFFVNGAPNANGSPTRQKIELRVGVVKEGGRYKLDSVTPLTNGK